MRHQERLLGGQEALLARRIRVERAGFVACPAPLVARPRLAARSSGLAAVAARAGAAAASLQPILQLGVLVLDILPVDRLSRAAHM